MVKLPNEQPPRAATPPGPKATAAQARYRRPADYEQMTTVRDASEYIDHLVKSGYQGGARHLARTRRKEHL
eukprot:3780659-Alexandrium_andersonii.AAC.1